MGGGRAKSHRLCREAYKNQNFDTPSSGRYATQWASVRKASPKWGKTPSEVDPQECQLPLSEASQGGMLAVRGRRQLPSSRGPPVKGVPLRLAGAGSQAQLPPSLLKGVPLRFRFDDPTIFRAPCCETPVLKPRRLEMTKRVCAAV